MSGGDERDGGLGEDRVGQGGTEAGRDDAAGTGNGAGRAGALNIRISPGELIDRITILELKAARLPDPQARARVGAELADLTALRDRGLSATPELDEVAADLAAVNADLWAVEDDLRACEARADFGAGFIALARAVYRLNDRRAALKNRINDLLGADMRDEKSHPPY